MKEEIDQWNENTEKVILDLLNSNSDDDKELGITLVNKCHPGWVFDFEIANHVHEAIAYLWAKRVTFKPKRG